MQPTPPTPTPAPPALEPVIELIRTQRLNVGYALLVAAAVCLAGTAWLGLKTSKIAATPDAGAKDKDAADKDELLKSLQPDGGEVTQPNRVDYIVGAVGTFLAFIAFAGVGGFLVAAPPKLKEEEQRTQARLVALVLGSAVGAALVAAGAFYFYVWSESLVKWLDKGEFQEARWVLIPLLMVVAGGALMFVSSQPARAEERNNSSVRQYIYGSNFGLTILMVFVVLVIANAVVALRVPNKLDVTATGFYSLSPQTKQLVEGLEQPVHAYAIFQSSGADQVTEDTKQLLEKCRDTNPAKFRVTNLSPALNRDAINKLKAEYPLAEMSREGILLVAGDEGGADRKRHSFIRSDELSETKSGQDGREVPTFNGEPRLLRELMFLAESKQKPKIYFTQSSGELALGGGGRGEAKRTAAALKTYLEKNYFDVQPLTFELGTAKVPDDAAVVVVADPTSALPPNGVEAIRKFMTEPRPDGKKGKLVVLAGMQPGPDGKPLTLGIEPILQPFGVRLSDRFVYGEPKEQLDALDGAGGTRVTIARVTQEGAEARNPVALGFKALSGLPLLDCREVLVAPAGTTRPVAVLVSQPGRLTWVDTQYARNPLAAWGELNDRADKIMNGSGSRDEKTRALAELQAKSQMSTDPRGLALFVSEGETARVAVFGCGWFISDDASGRASGMSRGQAVTLWLDLMGATLDWVRDRPTVGIVSEKAYTTYTLKPGYDSLRMLWVPLALAVLAVGACGAGVWVVRRK